VVGMMSAVPEQAPMPDGATEVSDWADVGKPEEFRCFSGPIQSIPKIRYWDGTPDGNVTSVR
jgi:hypothetical protein